MKLGKTFHFLVNSLKAFFSASSSSSTAYAMNTELPVVNLSSKNDINNGI